MGKCLPEKIIDFGVCEDKSARNLSQEYAIAKSIWRSELRTATRKVFNSGIRMGNQWKDNPVVVRIPRDNQAAYMCLDFGKNLLATPEIAVESKGGGIIDLGYSEVLENDRVAVMRQGIAHAERIILRKGKTIHRINTPRGFRYMVIRFSNGKLTIKINNICAYNVTYPVKENGKFDCSDKLLKKIYEISKYTLSLCMEDVFTDCPWRERSQWLGDFQPEALVNYYCFGVYDLARKAVYEFSLKNQEGKDWISGVSPATKPFNLPTWGMRFPVIAWEYYMFTGDRSLLRPSYEAGRKQLRWLANFENKDGFTSPVSKRRNFVDWTKLDAVCGGGVVQGWYLEAMESFIKLAKECDEKNQADYYAEKANRLRKAIAKKYWSKKRKAFLKYRPDSSEKPDLAPNNLIGQQENFLFVRLKIGTRRMRKNALKTIAGETGRYLPNLGNYQSFYAPFQSFFTPDGQKGNVRSEHTIYIGSPFWSFYALLCLFENGKEKAALEYIRLCWGIMLEHGATTCWEMWDRNTSCCHGWSASPGMMLPAFILGVKPTKPGFKEFEIRPNVLDLKWAEGSVPTPNGIIHIEWKISNGKFIFNVKVPEGERATFFIPKEYKDYRNFTSNKIIVDDAIIKLNSGKYNIEIC